MLQNYAEGDIIYEKDGDYSKEKIQPNETSFTRTSVIPGNIIENNPNWFEEIIEKDEDLIDELAKISKKLVTNGDCRVSEVCEVFIKYLKNKGV